MCCGFGNLCAAFFVGEHDTPQVSGEVSLEGSGCRSWRLVLSDFGVVLGAAETGRHPDLDHCDGVDRRVQLSIAVAG